MNGKQTILRWLESGDLIHTAGGLKFLAEKHADANLEMDARLLLTRLNTLFADRARAIISEADFLLEKNRIQFALQGFAFGLPENWPADGLETVAASPVFFQKKKPKLEKLALWLGILAAVLAIAGYSMRDFFQKKEIAPAVQPVAEPAKPVEKPAEALPKTIDKTAKPPKNQTNIIIKDQGKAGTIITGDSNKIDIKQDF